MSRYSPTVRPDDEPARDPTRFGRQVSDAFTRYRQDVRNDELDQREDEEYSANRPLRELRRRAGEVETEEYLRDTRGYVPSDRTSGTMPGGAGQPGPGGFDPAMARDIFRNERLGMARGTEPTRPEAGAYVGRIPGTKPPQESDPEIVALPGQFMGGQFAPEVVRLGGREYQVDPRQTRASREEAAARAAAEAEDADFQQAVRELVAAGVDPMKAPAIVRQGVADDYLQPGEEPVTFDPDKGIFPSEQARREFLAYKRELALAEEAGRIERDERDPGTRRGSGSGSDRPISVEDAFDRLQEIYTQTDRRGNATLLLPESKLVELANQWAAGEIEASELPRLQDLQPAEEAPPEEEGGGFLNWVRGFFQQQREDQGPPPAQAGAAPAPPEMQTSVDSARAIVREFPGVPPSQIRVILEEEGFGPREIDQVLGQGG